MTKTTSKERMRKMRKIDKEEPERKHRKLDTIYMFGYVEIAVIIDLCGDVWFRGVDVARALEMEDPNQAIYDSLDIKYTKKYDQLTSDIVRYRHIPGMHPDTTFVNEAGVNMFVLRSRMPKAERFAEWVCGVVLPSIRKTNKYEISPENNPYKELNEFMKKQIEKMEFELKDLKSENREIKQTVAQKDKIIENKDSEISKLVANVFTMKPSCVMENKDRVKDEYCIIYKKTTESSETIENAEILHYPYYACRVQEDSIMGRLVELKSQYPNIIQLRKYKTPNSVNFFNYILTEVPTILERGNNKFSQSFRIRDSTVSEKKCFEIIDNVYRVNYVL